MRENSVQSPILCLLAMSVLVSVAVCSSAEESRKVATIGEDGVQRIEMVGGGYYYDPDHIVVKVDVPVEITIHKEKGFVPHDIAMDAPEAGMEFNVELKTSPTVIRFTPTQTGTFPFACTKKLLFLKSHKDHGMKGVVEVVP